VTSLGHPPRNDLLDILISNGDAASKSSSRPVSDGVT
jgi:hypothetical protein